MTIKKLDIPITKIKSSNVEANMNGWRTSEMTTKIEFLYLKSKERIWMTHEKCIAINYLLYLRDIHTLIFTEGFAFVSFE